MKKVITILMLIVITLAPIGASAADPEVAGKEVDYALKFGFTLKDFREQVDTWTSFVEGSHDTISRQAAIRELENLSITANRHDETFFRTSDVYGVIDALPAEQPEQGWIPVSERLPKEKGVYLVTDNNGDVVRYVFNLNNSSKKYWERCVKAWMPLPSPYQPE